MKFRKLMEAQVWCSEWSI